MKILWIRIRRWFYLLRRREEIAMDSYDNRGLYLLATGHPRTGGNHRTWWTREDWK